MNDNPKPTKNGFKFPEHSIKTKITDVKPNELVTRGYHQEDLITNLSFAEMVFLLLRERLPDERESKIFNHILVSFCDHGVTPPSTQSARLIASSGANINNAVAGGLLSFGKNHAGAIEKAMDLFQESISSLNLEETAEGDVNRKIAARAIEIVDKYQSEIEKYIAEELNKTDIGPLGLGGKTTVLGSFVNIGSQRASGVRIVAARPACFVEPRVSSFEF